MTSHKEIDRRLSALDDEIADAKDAGDAEHLQDLYLKRERLQERSFKAFQKTLKKKREGERR